MQRIHTPMVSTSLERMPQCPCEDVANSGLDHPRAGSVLPTNVVFTESAAGQLRRYLVASGLGDWTVVGGFESIIIDIDEHLAALGESEARWHALPALVPGGHQPAAVADSHPPLDGTILPAGVLWLSKAQVVLARWHIFSLNNSAWTSLWLAAVPQAAQLLRLRRRVAELRRAAREGLWQIMTGEPWLDTQLQRDNTLDWDRLVLAPDVRRRLEGDVGAFFTAPVARLYRELQIPYRRGVLMHGPPGCGKTSIIRVVGALNPDKPVIVLRPSGNFDDSDFQRAISEWRDQAPAILVIEDLDWLLPRISVSSFLNRIDGLEVANDGLLMLATTNHPEALDPAINNRPGRFDVVIEVAAPNQALRLRYLRESVLANVAELSLEALAGRTEGLSFAHLREIVHLSGLHAARDGRAQRSAADVEAAVTTVLAGHDAAERGFAVQPETPFGLAPRRDRV
jgi:hypothetical protein